MRVPFRWKLILAIGTPLLVVYLVVLAIAYDTLKARAYHQAQTRVSELALRRAAVLDGRLKTIEQVARSTALFLTAHAEAAGPEVPGSELFALLRQNVLVNDLIYGACIAFEPGTFKTPDGRRLFAPYVCRDIAPDVDGGKPKPAAPAAVAPISDTTPAPGAPRAGAGRAAPGGELRQIDLSRAYDYTDGQWDWYTIPARSRHPVWTEPYFDEGAGNVVMCTHSVPFYRDGKLWGIATVDVRLDDLQRRLDDRGNGHGPGPGVGSGESDLRGAAFVITSRKGTYISHPDAAAIMTGRTIHGDAELLGRGDVKALAAGLMAGNRGVMLMDGFPADGANFVFYAPIPSAGWSFMASLPESQIMSPVWVLLRRFSGVMLAGLGLTLGILMFTAAHVTRPVDRLASAVSELAAGNLDVHVAGVERRDEFGDLSAAFNAMVDQLKAHVQALTVETARRQVVESELRLAREIQASLLPRTFPPFPHRPEFDLHACNHSARLVAGDFFDFFFVSDDVLMIVIADVSGKGVPAALFMAVTRTVLRNLALDGLSPSRVLDEANRVLARDNDRRLFVTAWVAHYEPRTGRLRYANAAHPAPYRIPPGGTAEPFGESTGTLLGVFEEEVYHEAEVELGVGERVFLYTDGLPEARDAAGRFFGDGGVEGLLARLSREPVDRFCSQAADAVSEYQSRELSDDVTIMMLQRNA